MRGAVLTSTLYLPNNGGRHPAVVWILGGQQTDRLTYGDLVGAFIQGDVGFFSYDKRGGGQSQGECCPGDYGHFNLLTADAVGAVNALRASTDVDPEQIGFVGTSQAGWIVPRAAVVSRQVAFVALASAAVLPYEQVTAYATLTGGTGSDKPFPSKEEIAKTLKDAGPSGADPRPDLEQLTIPALWLYGTADREVPVEQSVASPPTDPQAPTAFVGWVLKQVHTENT